MTNIYRRLMALACALLMLFCCSACSLSGSTVSRDPYSQIPDSTPGKDVERAKAADEVFSLNSNSKFSFNPLVSTYHCNQLVCSLVYENMVELDNNFEPIANVVKTWSCNEDGTIWTFNIDPDWTFHDGSKVTGKDLRYSLDRCIYADRYAGRFASYQGAAYTDTQLQVVLGIGDTQFVKLMNIPIIKSGDHAEKYPMGCGPYMFDGYTEEGIATELKAYEGHPDYAKLPVDTVYLVEYPTPDGSISAFEDSIIDVAINDRSSIAHLGYASTNESRSYPTTRMHYVAFNEDTTLGRYSSFRFAMNFAFDRSYLTELLKGYATPTAIPMYPTCDIYPQEMADSLKYNLDRCVQILYNAGIRDYNGDGKMEISSDSSQKVELNFLVCSDSSAKSGIVDRFVQDMASIGITINVYRLGWDDYLTVLEEGEYEITEKNIIKFDMYYGEIKLRNNFDLTELLDVESELNFTHSKDTTYEILINDYLGAGDTDRYNRYYKLCEYLTQMGAFITIGFEDEEIITHGGAVKGVNANLGNPLYGFENWTLYLTEDGKDSRDHRQIDVPVIYPSNSLVPETTPPEETAQPEEAGQA